jgi:transposase InsO family protein
VHNWVRQERIDRGERAGTTSEDREEIAKVRAEVKRLTTERDLLKRNTRRLHSSIGRIPPIEWEISYRRQEQQAA